MRLTVLLVLAACAKSAPPPATPEAKPPASDAEIRAALARSAEAYKQKDWAGFLEGSRAAARLSPESPDLRYRVARALVRAGKAAEGIAQLDQLAGMGLAYRVTDNPDLASVQTDPAFKLVVERMTANQTPVGAGLDHITLAARDLLVESIAYDSRTGSLFASSVHQRKILRLEPKTEDFLAPSEDVWAVLDLAVDAAHRKLWAGTAAMPQMSGYNEALEGRSAVLRLDLDHGAIEKRWELPGKHNFGDLTLDHHGVPWVSDNTGGGVYRVDDQGMAAIIAPGRLKSPQGIAFSADGARAYISDYTQGVFVYDLARGTLRPLPHPDTLSLYGVDGLLLHASGLIAMQNGVQPHRLTLLHLDGAGARITGGEVLDMNDHVLEPTHGTIVGDRLYYVATSQWHNFDDDGALRPPEELTPAIVRQLAVPQPLPRL